MTQKLQRLHSLQASRSLFIVSSLGNVMGSLSDVNGSNPQNWKWKNRSFVYKRQPLKFTKSVATDVLAPDYRKDSASDDIKFIYRISNA